MLVAIGAGGAVGGLARYQLSATWDSAPDQLPWTTLGINLSGALLLGVIATLVIERWPPTRYVRPFLAIGFCGAFTTWSTFMTETVLRVRDHHAALAAIYVVVSLVGGIAATYTGVWAARRGPARRRPA